MAEQKSNHLNDLMALTMEKIREMADSNTIIGNPITMQDGTTIIPVSRVTFGFASGGSDIGAFGRSALSAHLMDDGQIVKLRDGEFRFNKNQLFFLVLRSHESCCSCAAARKELVYSNIIGRIDSVRPPIRTFA